MFVRQALLALIIILSASPVLAADSPAHEDAHLSVAPFPGTVPVGKPLPITVRVLSGNGQPLPDVQVELLESGEAAWTNSEGEATFNFKEDAPAARNLTFIARERFTTEGKKPLDASPLKVPANWSRVRLTVESHSAIVPPDGADNVRVPIAATWEHDGRPVPGARVLAQIGNESLTLSADGSGVATWNATGQRGAVVSAAFSLLTPAQYPANDASATVVWLDEFLDLHAGEAVGLQADAPNGVAPHSVKFTVRSAPEGWRFLVDFGDGFNTGWSPSTEFVHTYADPGDFTARVAAMDSEGRLRNVDATTSVLVASPENLPPTVVADPLPDVLRGTVRVTGDATDADAGVALVEWRVDNGPWHEAMGTSDWVFSLPTHDYPNGPHRLFLRAVDEGHRVSEVAVLDVKVENGAITNVSVIPTEPRIGEDARVRCEVAGATASVVLTWANETLDTVEVEPGVYEGRFVPASEEDVGVTCRSTNAFGDEFAKDAGVAVRGSASTPGVSFALLALSLCAVAVLRPRRQG